MGPAHTSLADLHTMSAIAAMPISRQGWCISASSAAGLAKATSSMPTTRTSPGMVPKLTARIDTAFSVHAFTRQRDDINFSSAVQTIRQLVRLDSLNSQLL